MDKDSILAKLHTMTIEDKLALLSDTDKAYVQDYLNRAVPEFRLREQELQGKTAVKGPEKSRRKFLRKF
jgi:hypothetical protein